MEQSSLFEDVNAIFYKLYGIKTIQPNESFTKPEKLIPLVVQTHLCSKLSFFD